MDMDAIIERIILRLSGVNEGIEGKRAMGAISSGSVGGLVEAITV